MSLLFFFDLETKDYNNLKDVIDAADAVITEISEETENFAKRSLIKFLVNKTPHIPLSNNESGIFIGHYTNLCSYINTNKCSFLYIF